MPRVLTGINLCPFGAVRHLTARDRPPTVKTGSVMARFRTLALLLALTPAARATPRAVAAPRAPALAREANLALIVTSRAGALDRIKNAADDLGGRLVQGLGRVVTVEVPSGRYQELLQRLGSLGDEQDVSVRTTDLTDRIAAAEAKLRAAREQRERLSGVQGVAHGVPDHLMLERAMERAEDAEADARSEIENLRERAGRTRARILLVTPTIRPVPRPRLPFPWLAKLGLPKLLDTSAPKKKSYRLSGIDDGAIFLQGGYTPDQDKLGGARALGALGVTVRIVGDPDPVALYGGFDLSLGGSGGFVYGLQSILGGAVPIGRRVALGVGSGPGIDGITSTIPFGVSFPIEAYLSLDLFKWMGATARVRDGWVLAARSREHGAPAAPFGDEASAALTFALGTRHGGNYSQKRNGPSFGLAVRQTMGATFYLVNFGYTAHESSFTERY
jgi:hypothetical protein